MKIAFCVIVKGDDEEAKHLANLLYNVKDHVDQLFVTITQPNKKVEDVAIEYGAIVSHFEWCNDFAKARNFNFSQVPKEYEYILWGDADDQFRGLDNLREILEKNPQVDVFSINYLYHFNEYRQADVVHIKTQIVKNDGCVEWVGKLHEDFKENRQVTRFFIEDIERLHLTTEDRINKAKERNVEVAKGDVETNPNDPRSYWNLGNSFVGNGNYEEARKTMEKFISISSSDEEKYLTYINLLKVCEFLGDKNKAIEYGRMAIGIRPEYPDAYHSFAQFYFNEKNYKEAEKLLLLGLTKKPPYFSIIVYNPRDYDINPLSLLAKVYWYLARPDQALICLEQCLKIQPRNEQIKQMIELMKKDADIFNEAIKWVAKLKKLKTKEAIKKTLDKVPKHLQSYPAICSIRNAHFIKTESSGKDIVYYCGITDFEWSANKGKVGGSEEAVINLTKQWAKQGYNVTVYNNCGHEEQEIDGVKWKPFWMFNVKDKQDLVILWRHPIPADHNINADKIFLDLHDVLPEGELIEKRLAKINKIFVKTNFHRSLFPNIPDDKFVIIPNGMDLSLLDGETEKNQYLMINTSSPDRCMDVLPRLFKKVKEIVPEARLKWAYGFDIYDIMHQGDSVKENWKKETLKLMEEVGIENCGRLSQEEVAKLYKEANILAYPTEFAEIDCISVKKAQACGTIPVTSDFGALNESVQFGVKIPSPKTKDNWALNGKFTFGMESGQEEWVNKVVEILQKPIENREEMKEWSKKFNWDKISLLWTSNFHDNS